MEYTRLNWRGSPFNYRNMVRIHAIMDGSCFFHALVGAFFKPYREGHINGTPINKKEFVKKFRMDLAKKLGSKVDPLAPDSKKYYDVISRGELEEYSKEVPHYSLESMQKELMSSHPVDTVYLEFISDILDKDIYLLYLPDKDVYMIPDQFDLLYKGRDSIVLLGMPGHYDLVGLQASDGTIKTFFTPDNQFIRSIRERIRSKIALGSG